MIKNAVLIFNVIALFIYKAFFTQAVSISHNIPATVKAGSEFTVELTVNKADVSGFAKFQQELPAGFTATAVETRSGSFSFIDQTVKLIWMSLPSEKEFKISYKVTVGADAKGSHAIAGKFSYIENNEKQTFNLEPVTVSITSDEVIASETPKATAETTATAQDTAAAKLAAADQSTTPATNSMGVSASRLTPTTVPGNDFIVEITINKGNVTGFAKLEETLPAGFTATGVETKGSVFSFVDQKAKFLWMNLPSEAEFKITYRVKAESTVPPGNYTLEGLFSYLDNDVTQKFLIKAEEFKFKPEIEAAKEEPIVSAQESKQAEKTEEAKTNGTKTPALTNIPSGQTGVNFRVQITALRKTMEPSYFKTAYSLNEEIYAEMHEGWHKFTVGGYPEYKAARDKRQVLAQNSIIPGPFVSAYNSGVRITVQEALMIAGQKWVK